MERRALPQKRQAVATLLDAIVGLGFAPEVVFRDWVDIMFFGKMGEGCADILEKYRGKDLAGENVGQVFGEAARELFSGMSRSDGDGLGELYAAYCPASTPEETPLPFVLYEAFAAIHLSTMSHIKLRFPCEDRFAEKRGFRLAHAAFGGAPDCRPAAGTPKLYDLRGTSVIGEDEVFLASNCRSGGLLVAFIQRCLREGKERVKYVGQDKSLVCARMTALNLVGRGVEGLVLWADDHLEEIKGMWAVLRWSGLGFIHPVPTKDYADLRKLVGPFL